MDWALYSTAIGLGLLTAISPCPLATNITAISFMGRQLGQRRAVLVAGGCYALGRTLAYVGLAVLIATGLTGSAELSRFLQRYLNELLGPILILLGLVLLGWLGGSMSLQLGGDAVQKRAATGNAGWALVLGVLFALSFCPVSAGLYFGGLIPLTLTQASPVTLPLLYGLGTAAPVIGFAVLIAFAAERVGKMFNRLTQIEKWVRTAAGALFILTGLYYSLRHIYELTW
jgi:cytochrome c biogenesis protein CcdA